MKTHFLLFALPFIVACNQTNNEPSVNSGNSRSDSVNATIIGNLRAQLQKTNSTIQVFMKTFNEIEGNLNKIRAKEQHVAESTQSKSVNKKQEDEIISDINFINSLLDLNKQNIDSLNERMKDSSVRMLALESSVSMLSTRVTEKEKEVRLLKKNLVGMNIRFNELNTEYDKVKKESAAKTEKLNTAYCAIGSFNELKKQGIINAKGGFIGIGKVGSVNENVNEGMYSAIDIYQTKEISIASKKVKLISMHPAGTYTLDTRFGIKTLTINNPDEFWKTSRFLIIEASSEEPTYE